MFELDTTRHFPFEWIGCTFTAGFIRKQDNEVQINSIFLPDGRPGRLSQD